MSTLPLQTSPEETLFISSPPWLKGYARLDRSPSNTPGQTKWIFRGSSRLSGMIFEEVAERKEVQCIPMESALLSRKPLFVTIFPTLHVPVGAFSAPPQRPLTLSFCQCRVIASSGPAYTRTRRQRPGNSFFFCFWQV